MAELLLQGLRWVWVGLQSCIHYRISPLLEENEQGTGGKAGLQEGPTLVWAVYIPQGSQAQLHREGWLAGSPLAIPWNDWLSWHSSPFSA